MSFPLLGFESSRMQSSKTHNYTLWCTNRAELWFSEIDTMELKHTIDILEQALHFGTKSHTMNAKESLWGAIWHSWVQLNWQISNQSWSSNLSIQYSEVFESAIIVIITQNSIAADASVLLLTLAQHTAIMIGVSTTNQLQACDHCDIECPNVDIHC